MKKIILVVAGILLLLLTSLIALPFLFKDRIIQLIKETANENVNAHIDFSNDISLSVFSHFPDLTLGIKDLSITGTGTFEGDTLLALKTFSATLDIMSVIKGEQIRVRSILLDEPRVHAIVAKDGKANWDIAKPGDSTQTDHADTATTRFDISLKKFEVVNGRIIYDDREGNMYADLEQFNHVLRGDFSQDLFEMQTQTSSEKFTFIYGGIPYLSKVNMKVQADIDADMKGMKFTFKENTASLNELGFSFDGFAAMPGDDIEMDIRYAANKSEFRHFLSLVPSIYSKDFSQVQSSGKLAFDGFVKGIYNERQMPAFLLRVLVENGMFKYPSLPMPVQQVQVNMEISNPDGNLDHTKVDLSKLHFEISGDPFDARMIATNIMKDPAIDAYFKGRINLDNVSRIVPLEEGTKVSGIITADLTAKGKISTVENQQYEDFDAKGNISVKNMTYASKDLPKPFRLTDASLSFSPKIVRLERFDAHIGNSDMQMSGDLAGFFAYALGKGTIKGTLNLHAGLIDANEFMGNTSAAAQPAPQADTASLSAPAIPANVDFTINSSVDRLLYTNMEITSFRGQLKVQDQKLSFNQVGLQTLGSTLRMDGYYETTHPEKPTLAMNFGIHDLDIQKAFVTFNTVKKIAPIAEKTNGSFSAVFRMTTSLDQHMNPVYEDLFAEGTLDIPHAAIKNVPLFNKAAEILKYDRLKDPALNNVKIRFRVEKGRIYTQPFDIGVAGQKMTLAGSTGLDQTIDYTGKISIPRTALGGANNVLDAIMKRANAEAGTELKLNEMIDLSLKIGGTFTNPNISTNLSDVAKSQTTSLKDQVTAEADRRKKVLELKAKEVADRVRAEKEAKMKAQADKVRAEADRLKKEAEAKAKQEEEKAKAKAEEEAKKKLKGVFGR